MVPVVSVRLRIVGVASWSLLAACVSLPCTPVPRALERFADACQFVPLEMQSLSFREELTPEAAGLPDPTPQRLLQVRAGREFAPPPSHGYGRYRGIEILDLGAGGVSRCLPPEDMPPADTIGGIRVWFTPEQLEHGYCAPCWRAMVDDRYLLLSSEREIIAQALERTGRLERLLAPFAAARELADDAEEIVCALPRPDDRTYWGRPVPVEPVVSAMRPGPWRLQAFHQQELPAEYLEVFDVVGHRNRCSSTRVGAWTRTEVQLAVDVPPSTTTTPRLAFDLLFGLSIII